MGFGSEGAIQPGVVDLATLKVNSNGDAERITNPTAEHLAGHPAVVLHGVGVTTADLASYQEAFADYCQSRIKGIGAAQYDDGKGQKFEAQSFNEIILELVDEIADAQNYLTMLSIKVLTQYGFMDAVTALKEASALVATNE